MNHRGSNVLLQDLPLIFSMSLLEDIQTALVDQNSDLGTILRKCKLLAVNLGSQPLEHWLLYESNGYPLEIQVPDYRVWSLEFEGHFSGPFGSGLRDARIPWTCLPKEILEMYKNYECRQSIASLEAMLEEKHAGEGICYVSTGDLSVVLGTKVYEGLNCIAAWGEFDIGHIIELRNVVRNRILDFILALWKDNPNAGNEQENIDHQTEAGKVSQIFYTTIFGGSANLVGTATDSSITFKINNNDFPSLERALTNNGVNTEDIQELKAAIFSDPKPVSQNNLGPKVSQWIAKMVQKAPNGGWNVGVGAAGGLLAHAIAKYYGL